MNYLILEKLLLDINLPLSVSTVVIRYYQSIDLSEYDKFIDGLLRKENAFENFIALSNALGKDEDHFKMLTVQLEAAQRCRALYHLKGIDDGIYIATMRCFTRFLNEFYTQNGYYCFDRSWWTYRQLNMSIFRLGALEFEFGEKDGTKVINMHIPSDADIKIQNVVNSVNICKSFCKAYYPEFMKVEYVCRSWIPGHSTAILAAYNHSCRNKKVEIASTFGVHERIFCAGNGQTYQFIYALLDEIAPLFKNKYFHIGGDEAPKDE